MDPRNPPELHEDVPNKAPIPGEISVEGPARSVVMIDSRIWHTSGENRTDKPRVTLLTRYSPWWISLEFGQRNLATVPRDAFETFPDVVKDLYRHGVEGEPNPIRHHTGPKLTFFLPEWSVPVSLLHI